MLADKLDFAVVKSDLADRGDGIAPDARRPKPSRGPKITLKCDCGEQQQLQYGERWQCEGCGRTWDTLRIPAADYFAVRRIRRRFLVIPVVMLVAVAATVVLFILLGRAYGVILGPAALAMWTMYGRPIHRRRLRRALDSVPEWKIRPE